MRSKIPDGAAVAPLLVTGFDPFGGDTLNPSGEVARALHGATIDGAPVIGVVLPCAFGTSLKALRRALATHRPQVVLALGLAAGRDGFSLERVAINCDDARIADNAGAQPIDTPVIRGAPAAHFSTLPIKAMTAALRAAGYPASVSNSAGTFVCNHVFFGLQQMTRRRAGVRSGFMHLCSLPAQARGAASLPLEALVEGVALALAVARERTADEARSEGALA